MISVINRYVPFMHDMIDGDRVFVASCRKTAPYYKNIKILTLIDAEDMPVVPNCLKKLTIPHPTMPRLSKFDNSVTRVADWFCLAFLVNTLLTYLDLGAFDGILNALKDLPLEKLYLNNFTGLAENPLEPISECPIRVLHMNRFNKKINMLENMPIIELQLNSFDKCLAPLINCPLKNIQMDNFTGDNSTLTRPLSPLSNHNLEHVRMNKYEKDIIEIACDTLISIEMKKNQSLDIIEFWRIKSLKRVSTRIHFRDTLFKFEHM